TAVRFTDYAPMVFRRLREMFQIDRAVYIHSIGPEQVISNLLLGSLSSLCELVSEGKSGALFYYTADGRYIIKTVSRSAAAELRRLLPAYYEHFVQNPDSLLTRCLGLHAIKHAYPSRRKLSTLANQVQQKTYFLVMENLFHTPVPIHRRYDLKGSSYKRTLAPEIRVDPTVALKDNDLEREGEKIDIGPEKAARLLKQLQQDANFLCVHRLMDYSLLIGIYYANKNAGYGGGFMMRFVGVQHKPSDERRQHSALLEAGVRGSR
ncbi:Phosphatidylinositol-4-phosphate 5-kinase 9, related, partial [Eimeria acervulina]